MAVAAFQIQGGTVRSAANGLQVSRVIEFNRAGVVRRNSRNGTQRGELGMAVFEVMNVLRILVPTENRL